MLDSSIPSSGNLRGDHVRGRGRQPFRIETKKVPNQKPAGRYKREDEPADVLLVGCRGRPDWFDYGFGRGRVFRVPQ